METNYKFTVGENNEVIFTKDEEVISYSHEQLVETIKKVFKYSSDDADYYAKHLENLCKLALYNEEFKSKGI